MKHYDYLQLLERWVPDSRQYLFKLPDYPEYLYYGEGTSAHWSIQTNCNVFAAYSVIATDPTTDSQITGISNKDLLNDALALLRGIMHGHLSGDAVRADGEKWGCTWISPLGLERMMHGVEAIWDYLMPDDIAALRRMLTCESDWHTEEQPIKAGIHPPDNKPESNIWSGAMLYRTTDLFPDLPRVEEYRAKGLKFLLNGISTPADVSSEESFNGRQVKDLFIGPNFCENFSLDHHAYLNVGYMVICLSNLAMYHFSCKKRGIKTPPEVLRNVSELWNVVKKFTFEDGRLLRIGGDTRARYCYCQDYCIPSWLMMLDQFGDSDIPAMETGWLDIVKTEMDCNADGSFLSKRLSGFNDNSLYYYTRLEGDRASALSMGAYWRRIYNDFESILPSNCKPAFTGTWYGKYHGANLIRSKRRSASFCWEGAPGATATFQPTGDSTLAEWQRNLQGEVFGQGKFQERNVKSHFDAAFSGGFVTCGSIIGKNRMPLGEGEADDTPVAEQKIAFAALPDDNSIICLQQAIMLSSRFTDKIAGISWKIPNDMFNGFSRKYSYAGGSFCGNFESREKPEVIDIESPWLMIDESMSIHQVYGGRLQLNLPSERNIQVFGKPMLTSLACDEICCSLENKSKLHIIGEKVYDTGFVLRLGDDAANYQSMTPPVQPDCGEKCRGVIAVGADGKKYVLLANFGNEVSDVLLSDLSGTELSGISSELQVVITEGQAVVSLKPNEAHLFKIN